MFSLLVPVVDEQDSSSNLGENTGFVFLQKELKDEPRWLLLLRGEKSQW